MKEWILSHIVPILVSSGLGAGAIIFAIKKYMPLLVDKLASFVVIGIRKILLKPTTIEDPRMKIEIEELAKHLIRVADMEIQGEDKGIYRMQWCVNSVVTLFPFLESRRLDIQAIIQVAFDRIDTIANSPDKPI